MPVGRPNRRRRPSPITVDGFTFKTLSADVAQTYRERGHRGATTIRFDYRVPNG
jgi:hypothetical protein